MTAAARDRSARRPEGDATSRPASGKLHIADLVRARVARDDEPGMASTAVVPKLLVQAGRVVAQIDVVVESLRGVAPRGIGSAHRGVTEIGELVVSARTAIDRKSTRLNSSH